MSSTKRFTLAAILILFGFIHSVRSEESDENASVLRRFFTAALESDIAYRQLEGLCSQFKGRIAGTAKAAGAVEYTRQILEDLDLDRVFLQPLKVKNWRRGDPEQGLVMSCQEGQFPISISALGLSEGTGPSGLSAEIVEVKSFEELERLGAKKIRGKIVFFNKAMNPALINTFGAYGEAAFQRISGASQAAGYGAIAVIVRSLTLALDDHPHTGVMAYSEERPRIPAVAVSTMGAERLSRALALDPNLKVFIRTTCQTLPDTICHNVVGELTGSEKPGEVITIGGHLDAWDNSEGAHDDGGGCMQAIEVLRLFKVLGIRPRHTLRAVMFMDEEIAQRGGLKYAQQALENQEIHLAALESDRGVLTPRAIGISAPDDRFKSLTDHCELFATYGIKLIKGGGGVDIAPLAKAYPDITLMSLIPEDHRYFDYHHSAYDTFSQVNRREMQMGSAAMAAIIYLVDRQY